MAIGIGELRGVTDELAIAFHGIGIDDSAQLLAAAAQYGARAELATSLDMDAGLLLELVNRADMARIPGLTGEYVELLLLAGVDSVTELRRRIPENLYVKLPAVAEQHHRQQVPRLAEVQRWVREAKQLARAVYY